MIKKKVIVTNLVCMAAVTVYLLLLFNYGLFFVYGFMEYIGIPYMLFIPDVIMAFILGYVGYFLFKGGVFLRYILITTSQLLAHGIQLWRIYPDAEALAKMFFRVSALINLFVVGFGILVAVYVVHVWPQEKSTGISK